ncbi:hypothetical protein SESBI_31928 [Sesbania bispinosa]|nr:hypothetical protein SESBI_31928 [Sesbania bispinosa]
MTITRHGSQNESSSNIIGGPAWDSRFYILVLSQPSLHLSLSLKQATGEGASQIAIGNSSHSHQSKTKKIESLILRRAEGIESPKMLPTASKGRPSTSSSSSRPNSMLLPYFRRIIKWQQMDVEYTFWQMLHLCTSPKVVYQHTKYHKQTKNQWARDDPAFVVICSLLLAVATMAYCAAYDHSAAHALLVVFSVLLLHFFFTGVLLATFCWFLTNAYLREEAPNSYVVEQRVEWMYAFDVHCNSFFPMFVLLYVIHYFLSPLLVAHGFIPILLSNLLFMYPWVWLLSCKQCLMPIEGGIIYLAALKMVVSKMRPLTYHLLPAGRYFKKETPTWEDFDNQLMDYFIQLIKKKHLKDIRKDIRAIVKHQWECINPGEAVAYSAAIQGGIPSGKGGEKPKVLSQFNDYLINSSLGTGYLLLDLFVSAAEKENYFPMFKENIAGPPYKPPVYLDLHSS